MDKKLGFTLIELLTVITILAILSTITYSSYQSIVISTRRADAQAELTKAQIKQSSYHIIHPSFIDDAILLGLPTDDEFYTFSVVSASVNTYLLKAEAKASNSQFKDESMCRVLLINQDNIKTNDGEMDNASCWER